MARKIAKKISKKKVHFSKKVSLNSDEKKSEEDLKMDLSDNDEVKDEISDEKQMNMNDFDEMETSSSGDENDFNKEEDIVRKLRLFTKELPWIETLDVTVVNPIAVSSAKEDDFEREIMFYKQAELVVKQAIPKLQKNDVKVFRPSDYYAEMVKSDSHMQKVRDRILSVKEGKDRQETIRRVREERKFAAKVRKEVQLNKQSEKKKLLEAVKKHRKGMKGQLEEMLNNAKRLQSIEGDEEDVHKGPYARKMSRKARDQKFGYGGQKKRSKMNNLASLDGMNHGKRSKFGARKKIAKKNKRRRG